MTNPTVQDNSVYVTHPDAELCRITAYFHQQEFSARVVPRMHHITEEALM